VHRRPRVGILATGDEIALPGEPIPPGGIVSSNSHALAALVTAAGGMPVVLPVAPDDAAAIGAVAAQTDGLDLLLTSGGASVGDHDLVVSALTARGLVVDFWKVAMRPGKPLMAGRLNRTPVLGLPGNPVSSMVCAVLFAWPVLLRLSGAAAVPLPEEQAVLGAKLRPNDHRADFMRARLADRPDGVPVVTPFPVQDSGMLSRLARADALLLRAPHAPAAETGDPVSIIRLDRFGL
jgi:molybdopterin molybdotransferase